MAIFPPEFLGGAAQIFFRGGLTLRGAKFLGGLEVGGCHACDKLAFKCELEKI